MISRLTAFATTFALVAATAFAITAQAQAPTLTHAAAAAPAAAVRTVRVVELPRVVVVARRIDRSTAR